MIAKAVSALKYMLLSKIMLHVASDVSTTHIAKVPLSALASEMDMLHEANDVREVCTARGTMI